jgi:hypothetical protein
MRTSVIFTFVADHFHGACNHVTDLDEIFKVIKCSYKDVRQTRTNESRKL